MLNRNHHVTHGEKLRRHGYIEIRITKAYRRRRETFTRDERYSVLDGGSVFETLTSGRHIPATEVAANRIKSVMGHLSWASVDSHIEAIGRPDGNSLSLLTGDSMVSRQGNSALLLCPVCKFDFTHAEAAAMTGSDAYVTFNCEDGHRWEVGFLQHKGYTDIVVRQLENLDEHDYEVTAAFLAREESERDEIARWQADWLADHIEIDRVTGELQHCDTH